MNKTTVITHSADFDGLFCREIARKFLGDEGVEYIGWDFKDESLDISLFRNSETIYVMDLPIDRVFGLENAHKGGIGLGGGNYLNTSRFIWIDHHKSAIESHPTDIPGYRIDGVAACRLAWQFFQRGNDSDMPLRDAIVRDFSEYLPKKQEFIDRKVSEPLSVRLAGEYDIWDKHDPRAELFQHGLRSRDLSNDWGIMLSNNTRMSVKEIEGLIDVGHQVMLNPDGTVDNPIVLGLLEAGKTIQFVRDQEYADVITQQGFDVQFEGLTFLACNSHELDIRSHLFAAGIKPHHDALLGFTYNGVKKDWRVSMYHAPGKEHHDLSLIAVKHGGGGHRGACGMRLKTLPFV